jgi:hypothetical protein
MTDTLEIRRFEHGSIWWGVFDVAKGTFVASYPDQIHAYAWAVGYLNEHIRHLKADAERLTETNNALNKRMSA